SRGSLVESRDLQGGSVAGGRAGRRSGSGRLLTAPARPCLELLGGGGAAAGGAHGGWDLELLGADGAALLGGDLVAVEVADHVALPVAPARGEAGDEHTGDGAHRGVVVLAGVDDEPVVARREGGVDLAGVLGGEKHRF